MRPPLYYRMTGYDRLLLPNAHLASLEEGVTGPESWIPRSGHSVGYPAWGLIYYMILCAVAPGRRNDIIETGTNEGSSTIVLAQALADAGVLGAVASVEIDAENHAKAKRNIELAGLGDRVELVLGDSKQQLPAMLEKVDEVAVAFLDGSHMTSDVLAEFEHVYPRLADGALVLFDNTFHIAEQGEDQRVNGALRSILERFGGHVVNFPFCSWYTPGLAVWQRRPLKTMEPFVPLGAS
jgi:predicted O-methyltransferase YrrM